MSTRHGNWSQDATGSWHCGSCGASIHTITATCELYRAVRALARTTGTQLTDADTFTPADGLSTDD